MNEEKKSRGMPEVQQEYANLCMQAGQLQYQISCLTKDLEIVNGQLRDLNLEAAKLKAATSEEKKS